MAGPVVAQQPGPASFRVLQRGTVLGSAPALLTREEDDWLLQGSSDLPGFKLTVRHLEVQMRLGEKRRSSPR